VKDALASAIKQGMLASGQYRRALARTTFPGVAVLCYHGVRDDDVPDAAVTFPRLHILASTFEAHCRVIRECCTPISLDDWREALAGRAPLPPRPVLITFDDGYRSVARLAAPILAAHDLPAVVFVCTGPMASWRLLWFDAMAERDGQAAVEAWKSRPYDEWRSECVQSPVTRDDDPRAPMTRDELAVLSRQHGIEIGGHTVDHPILARATPDQQREQIARDLASIREWTGAPVRAFAYPNGRPRIDYTEATIAILRDEGIDAAFTTRPSLSRPEESALERSRFLIVDEVNDAELAHRLTYTWPR